MSYLEPFEAMVISWKGARPLLVEVQVLQEVWSPWIEYARWERAGQWGCAASEIVDVDCVRAARGARVRVQGDVEQVWLSVQKRGVLPVEIGRCRVETGPVWSQMDQKHEKPHALCSPTSLCHALGVLGHVVDPVEMAARVYDKRNQVHGNWAFAAAAAGEFVEGARVRWLRGLGDLQNELQKGKPVVVSVCGEIEGAPKVYSKGHLITVVGMDRSVVSVLDSAFKPANQVAVEYSLEAFFSAWKQRAFLAYTF